jgi:hypothetical protein
MVPLSFSLFTPVGWARDDIDICAAAGVGRSTVDSIAGVSTPH